MALDIGSAVGRFAFEMSGKSEFVVGIDNSVSFIQ
jgi:2-polyprenyl-3-methyl-5-hydroxy-6-metoxy-1,4-benzoquinol methylase